MSCLRKNWHIILSVLCYSLYLFLGLIGTYYNQVIYAHCDLFYDIDPIIKYNLVYMNILTDIDRHPFIFIVTPLLKAVQHIIPDPRLVLIMVQALVATFNNILLFLVLKKLQFRFSTCIFFTLIYALSFSTLLFAMYPEVYLYSSCIGLLLVNYLLTLKAKAIKKYRAIEDDSIKALFIIALLCVCGFGINLINIILYIPFVIYLISKYPSTEQSKAFSVFLFYLIAVFCLLCACGEFFYSFSKELFPDNNINKYKALEWLKMDFSAPKMLKVIQESIIAPFYILDTVFDSERVRWDMVEKQNYALFAPFVIFSIFAFFRKHRIPMPEIMIAMLSVISIHLILNCFYNNTWFLYSPNYMFMLVIIFAYLYAQTPEKLQNIVLPLFLLTQIGINAQMLKTFILWANNDLSHVVAAAGREVIKEDLWIIAFIISGMLILKIKQEILARITPKSNTKQRGRNAIRHSS